MNKIPWKKIKNQIRETAKRGAELGSKSKDLALDKASDIQRSLVPLSEENWTSRAAESCESVGDALLRQPGVSQRIVNAASGKLGMIGVPAAIFSTAALIGTASTGTAIGTLSGAAFTSAALAWVGGSVAVGGVILTVASLAGGVGAVVGASWVGKKYLFGKKRSESELDGKERRIVDACLALALAFRNEEKAGRTVDPIAARALYQDALKPLCDELLDYRAKVERWPHIAKKRFLKAKDGLETITSFASNFAQRNPHLTTGIVGAVATSLLADDLSGFDENEQIVLDALRRSKSSLANASNEELADYVQELEPHQLQGLSNNLLGISHELQFYAQENNDGDQYMVEIVDATNNPGSDVRIINTLTGDVRDVQLKASNYTSYIKQHNERYSDIPVMATDEVAVKLEGTESTGISHDELSADVENALGELGADSDPNVLSSMSLAGMITLSRNIKILLRGQTMSSEERSTLVANGARSAIVAGLVHTLIA